MEQPPPRFFPRKITGEERRRAIEEPGPSWKRWALDTGLKPWVALGFLILDGGVFLTLYGSGTEWGYILSGPTVAGALFLNYLAWQYLWHEPRDGESPARFRRTLLHPFYMGRFNERYADWKANRLDPRETESGVDARDFF
jgi:hypothetical protein